MSSGRGWVALPRGSRRFVMSGEGDRGLMEGFVVIFDATNWARSSFSSTASRKIDFLKVFCALFCLVYRRILSSIVVRDVSSIKSICRGGEEEGANAGGVAPGGGLAGRSNTGTAANFHAGAPCSDNDNERNASESSMFKRFHSMVTGRRIRSQRLPNLQVLFRLIDCKKARSSHGQHPYSGLAAGRQLATWRNPKARIGQADPPEPSPEGGIAVPRKCQSWGDSRE